MIVSPPIAGILFDFDGLILDTETPIFQAWQEMFRRYGQELLLEEWAKVIGKACDIDDPAEIFLENLPDEDERRRVKEEVSKRELELLIEKRPLPGAVELIQKSKAHGLKLGIVSSSDEEWIHTHLKRLGLEHYFDHTSCADEVEHAKPNPSLYLLALKKMEIIPEKVIVLEDSPNGVLAAKRAGLYCIAVQNTLTKQLPFYKNGGTPDMILDSLLDFPWTKFTKGDL
jgi:HAD superfamily hydrolase (TIGR01509 family)